jgi:hypothetical protein
MPDCNKCLCSHNNAPIDSTLCRKCKPECFEGNKIYWRKLKMQDFKKQKDKNLNLRFELKELVEIYCEQALFKITCSGLDEIEITDGKLFASDAILTITNNEISISWPTAELEDTVYKDGKMCLKDLNDLPQVAELIKQFDLEFEKAINNSIQSKENAIKGLKENENLC